MNETRRFNLILIICFLLGMLAVYLAFFRTKPKPAPAEQTTIYADTTRIKLVHRANSSADSLTIVQKRTDSSLTTYENARIHYDTLWAILP